MSFSSNRSAHSMVVALPLEGNGGSLRAFRPINLRLIFPQSTRIILVRSSWAIFAFLLSVLALVQTSDTAVSENFGIGPLGLLSVLTGILTSKISYEVLSFLSFSYVLKEDDLVLNEGVFFRERRRLKLERVKDIEVLRSPLERLFQLYTIRIRTHSGDETYFIPGLTKRHATALRSFLIDAIWSVYPLSQRSTLRKENESE